MRGGSNRSGELFRWFAGIGVDDPAGDHPTFSKNRDRLLNAEGRVPWRTTAGRRARRLCGLVAASGPELLKSGAGVGASGLASASLFLIAWQCRHVRGEARLRIRAPIVCPNGGVSIGPSPRRRDRTPRTSSSHSRPMRIASTTSSSFST